MKIRLINCLLWVDALSVFLVGCAWGFAQIKKVSVNFWLIFSAAMLGLVFFAAYKIDPPDFKLPNKRQPVNGVRSWFRRYIVSFILVAMLGIIVSEWGIVIALQTESVSYYNIAHNRIVDFFLLGIVILSMILLVVALITLLVPVKFRQKTLSS